MEFIESLLVNQHEVTQHLEAGVAAYEGKDFMAAEISFKKILAANPQDPSALHFLGCIYKNYGQLQVAIDLIQASIRLDDTNPIPFLNLGKILSIAGQYQNAVGIFMESLERDQSISETWFCLGNALREIGNTQEAKKSYRNALQLNSSSGMVASNLSALLIDDGELEEAEDLLSYHLTHSPQNVKLRTNYGKLWAEKKEFVLALNQYQIALSLDSSSPELYFNMANALSEDGQLQQAILNYRKAIELKPDFYEAYLNLGNALSRNYQYEESISSYRKATELNPDYVDAYFHLGLVLTEKGRFKEAIKSYRKAIDLREDFADAYYQLYYTYSCCEEHDDALNSLKICLAIDPHHFNARQSIGYAFSLADHNEEAIQYFSSRLEAFDFEYWAHLFEALEGRMHRKLLNKVDIKSRLVEEILIRTKSSKIVAFGDSHVNIFGGIDGIFVNYLGASTAYKLSFDDSSSGAGRRFKSQLTRLNPNTDAILLCFGEIDCRSHIIKQAYLQNKTIHDVALATAKSYFDLILSTRQKGFSVFVYGPYGTGTQLNSFGLEAHRNIAAFFFNQYLKDNCLSNDIFFFSLNDLLVDPKTLITRHSWLIDDVHLPDKGKSSEPVKVMLLSKMLLDVQSLNRISSSNNVEAPRDGIQHVKALGISSRCVHLNSYACLLESGLIQWQDSIDDSFDTICFDLGSVVALDQVYLSLRNKNHFDFLPDFSIDGVDVHACHVSADSDVKAVFNFPNHCVGRFLMLSGSKRLHEIVAISFVPVSLGIQ